MKNPSTSRCLCLLLSLAALVGCSEPSASTAGLSPAEQDAQRQARVLAMALDYEDDLPPVPQLTADQVMRRIASDPADARVVLLDCRTRRERNVSTLPGAITPDLLRADPQRYADAQVIVYCTIGYRSSKLVGQLRQQGVTASNLRGGVLAWAHAGGAFVDPQGNPTPRVHVYGRPWDLLPSAYESSR